MKLPTCLTFFFQALLIVERAALAKSPQEVSGYLGENITLHSGVDPSWSLTKIEWSIFTNNTWIATYHSGKTMTDLVHQYKGRLTLNTMTGDLTIHNLTAKDATEYTVDLSSSEAEPEGNTIKLNVKQKLREPSIQIVTSTSVENGCFMVVNCSSLDKGINLSWSVEPVSVLTINKHNPSDSSAQLFAFVNTTQNLANFTCTSRRDIERVPSKTVTPKCDSKICVSNCTSPPPPRRVTHHRARYSAVLFLSGTVFGSIGVIIIYRYAVQSHSLQHDLSLITRNCATGSERRQRVATPTQREEE
ncbi:uncharacterized protein LOC102208242 isoform X2 [Pundamilia nyererei]|uniref:Uncharacterized protein LOC102208242 isoform X2 n=1 Tax=Pundamilia nyererei TaxID=303518 RepID=A0A9Y3S5K5_9CICH|nr:PREDICTED: uncharacterized protein LOC102208242 isoform X2 [Pundamilia nyererei]